MSKMVKVLVKNTSDNIKYYGKRNIRPYDIAVINIDEDELIIECQNRELKVAYYFG